MMKIFYSVIERSLTLSVWYILKERNDEAQDPRETLPEIKNQKKLMALMASPHYSICPVDDLFFFLRF